MRWILALTKENTLNKRHIIEVQVPEEIAAIVFGILKKSKKRRKTNHQ